jgi:molybdopterin molybdotransferase
VPVVGELISVSEARDAVLAAVGGTLPAEPVPLGEALGRVLAEDAVAPEDVPGADNSAMDGFAVRAADTAGATSDAPRALRVAEESRAGSPASRAVEPGEAFRISTGGVLPPGADSVLRMEEVAEADGQIRFEIEVAPGRDIRRAGDDIRAGQTVLSAGTELGAAELGVLASMALPRPACARRPRLALVCTGDELLGADEPMTPGGVRNSNAYTVPPLATMAGAEVVSVARCRDDPEATREAIDQALAADVAVVCGGVSVGAHDHVKAALRDLGVAEVFWGVALRPGRPTWFGVRGEGPAAGGALAFGLPGNPVSAFVTCALFVRPALRALAGAGTDPQATEAVLAADVPRLPARDQAVRCHLELSPEGWIATPTGPQGSHILTSMLDADALAVVAAGPGAARAGERVPVQLLR